MSRCDVVPGSSRELKGVALGVVGALTFWFLMFSGTVRAETAALTAIDLRLPSSSTGVSGGALAVRLFVPAAGHARFADGAPVIVVCQGGTSAGDLNNPFPPPLDDVVVVSFLFPGGRQGPFTSSGTYDDRGERSIQAVCDVIRYAAGLSVDSTGKTIAQRCPVPVKTANVGAIGLSNGGNMVAAVAARHGAELAGVLRYVIQWESPVSSQIATVDLGGYRLIDGESHAVDFNALNPRYQGYGPLEASVYTADIRYNPAGTVPVFHDGNGDGVYTVAYNPATGESLPDLDFDGVLEMGEDFPLGAYTLAGRSVYSRTVSRALEANNAFGGAWPASILTVDEADAFWDLREAVRLAEDAVDGLPGLEVMFTAGVRDHVQSRPDKPHVRQGFESWSTRGPWVQINPGPEYLVALLPSLAGRTDLPHNAPNTPPADWANPAGWCYPSDVSSGIVNAGAVRQMAERVEAAATRTWAFETAVPFIACASGWESSLEACNTTGAEQALQIECFEGGDPRSSSHTVPAGTALRIPLTVGTCARVLGTSTGVSLAVVYRFTGLGLSLSCPLPKRLARDVTFLMPAGPSAPVWTGVALMNAGAEANTVRLEAVAADGTVLAGRTLALEARSTFAVMLSSVFCVSTSSVARIRAAGTGPLCGLTLSGIAGGSVTCLPALADPDAVAVALPLPTSGGASLPLVLDNPWGEAVTASVIPVAAGVEGAPVPVPVPAGGRGSVDLQPFLAAGSPVDGLVVRFGSRGLFARLAGGAGEAETLLTGRTAHRLTLPLGGGPDRPVPILFNASGITQRVRLTVVTPEGERGSVTLRLSPRARTVVDLASLFPALGAGAEGWLVTAGQGGLAVLGDAGLGLGGCTLADASPQTPVYLTFFSHNEDSWQGMVSTRSGYLEYRNDLLERLHLLRDAGVVLDWQSDWAVLDAVARFDTGEVTASTNGKNIVRYLAEDLGFSPDPHGHLVQYNYADIARLFRDLGVDPAPVIGGVIHASCGTGGELLSLVDWRADGEVGADGLVHGRVFPQETWRPEILSVPAFAGHWFDEMSSGVWNPGTLETFYLHDPARGIVYVGQGDPHDQTLLGATHASGSPVFGAQGSYVRELVDKLRRGDLPDGTMHTASLHIRDKKTPDAGGAETNDRLAEMLGVLRPFMDAGEIVSVTYPEAVRLWQDVYGANPGRTAIQEFSSYGAIEGSIKAHCGAEVPVVLFSINTHDWVLPQDSARTVNRILDIHEKYDVPVDVYLTDPVVQAYAAEAPGLLDRLRKSRQAVVSYHVRPPSPYYWTFDFLGLASYPADQLQALLLDYETHALDLATGRPGDGPGGYAWLAGWVGYAPPVVSGFSENGPVGTALLDLFENMGAGLYVVHGRVVEPGETAGPLFIRPEHVEMKLYEHPERDAAQWIREELEPWRGEETVYVNIKVHENNFYLWGTSWDRIYYGAGGVPRTPPFDLTAWEGTLQYRSEAEQAAQWTNYEKAVAHVAAYRYNYAAVDCLDVLAALQAGR
ncbi:MAG: hypothetical protein KA419_15605 [Acidobacteria bacterium]|nr:hypothetical protein [Acidobacteriota bacterium]